MEIRIFDPEVRLLGVTHSAESVTLTRRLFKPGEFELVLHPSAPYADRLTHGNLIMLDKDPARCGMILHTQMRGDEDAWRLCVRGRTLEGLMTFRLTVPPSQSEAHHEGWDRVRGPGETVMKHYVAAHFTQAENPYRNLPRLRIAPDCGRGPDVPWQARFSPVSDVLESLYPYTKLGYRVTLDLLERAFVFDIVEGVDRTAAQAANPRAVFDPGRGNLTHMVYTASHMDFANLGYAGGEGQEEDRLIYQIGDAAGYLRREAFLDCGGANIDELVETGAARLAEKQPQLSLEADVLLRQMWARGIGVGLGDYVTVRCRERGLALDTQITEITESHEHDKTRFSAVFGTQTPTIMDKMKILKGVR